MAAEKQTYRWEDRQDGYFDDQEPAKDFPGRRENHEFWHYP